MSGPEKIRKVTNSQKLWNHLVRSVTLVKKNYLGNHNCRIMLLKT